MISQNYQLQLQKVGKNLDQLVGEQSDFEKLIVEITADKNERAILMFVKKIGVLHQNQSLVKIGLKQEQIIELLYKYLGSSHVDDLYENFKSTSNYSLEQLLTQLYELIGLENVKQQVRDLMDYNKIQYLREKNGLKRSNKTLHMAFLGNPGTAKTTVARIIGKMYKQIGLLSKGHFIEVSRTDLIAEYQGQTAIKVKRLIQRAKGGVLFIDEAYSITENENSDSYGKECLTELTKALEDYRNDLVVIVAGYPNLMDQFFQSNPGLMSRFNTFIQFNDYTLDELLQIFQYTCEKNDYIADKKALEKVKEVLSSHLKEKNEQFANGRYVRNLFDDITLNQSKRILRKAVEQITKETLMLITEEDIVVHLNANFELNISIPYKL